MGNYSKLFGSLIGGVVGIVVSRYGLPAESAPELTGAITVLLSAFTTWAFPANKPSR